MKTGAAILSVMLLAGCSTTITSLSQHPIRVVAGSVTDNNDKPVKGAIITTNPPTSSIATDEQGRFLIKSLREGTYTINAKKFGFVADPVEVDVRGFEVLQADIKLIPEGMVAVKPASSASTASVGSAGEAAKTHEAPAAENTDKKRWWEK